MIVMNLAVTNMFMCSRPGRWLDRAWRRTSRTKSRPASSPCRFTADPRRRPHRRRYATRQRPGIPDAARLHSHPHDMITDDELPGNRCRQCATPLPEQSLRATLPRDGQIMPSRHPNLLNSGRCALVCLCAGLHVTDGGGTRQFGLGIQVVGMPNADSARRSSRRERLESTIMPL